MTTLATATEDSSRAQTIRELYELIAALDRRVPQVERVGEISIARAGGSLKCAALKRIEELEREAPASSILSATVARCAAGSPPRSG